MCKRCVLKIDARCLFSCLAAIPNMACHAMRDIDFGPYLELLFPPGKATAA